MAFLSKHNLNFQTDKKLQSKLILWSQLKFFTSYLETGTPFEIVEIEATP